LRRQDGGSRDRSAPAERSDQAPRSQRRTLADIARSYNVRRADDFKADSVMWWLRRVRRANIPPNLRAKFEKVGANVLDHALGAGQLSQPYPELEPLLKYRDEIWQWLRENRRREKRKNWTAWGIGWSLSLIVISIAGYNNFSRSKLTDQN
jgi:hypothetical protein